MKLTKFNSETAKSIETIAVFNDEAVRFIETITVCDGVECDTYMFIDDEKKDLGIVRVAPHHKTPRQRILLGDKTIEGYIDGNGSLVVEKAGGGRPFMTFRTPRPKIRSRSKLTKLCNGRPTTQD